MRLLLAAGGTGGHMFPAQALAEHFKAGGAQVAMITDTRGKMHTGAIPADPIIEVSAASLSASKPLKIPSGVIKLIGGIRQAKGIIREWKPDCVIGFGGYPAFPTLRAAQQLKIPTILHEQNAVLGRVNRVFAAKANVVASGFDILDRLPDGANWQAIGNPMRAEIAKASDRIYRAPDADGPINLLIVGGSLGATLISETVPLACAALPLELRSRLRVVQQTREGSMEMAKAAYRAAEINAVCAPFFTNIHDHLKQAHFIIGRAGASSVSEIALMGLPSLLVPLRIAMDDHQSVNALALKTRNCADILPESRFTPEAVKNILWERLRDSTYLAAASSAARSAAKPNATRELAGLVQSAIGAAQRA